MKVENVSEWDQIIKSKMSIEKLNFVNTEFLEFGDLIDVLRHCPLLVELRLERCFHVSNILLQALADYTPLLRNLYLSGCLLTEANLDLLISRCRHLKEIDFSCTKMTMNALLILMDSSPWLEKLDLSEIQSQGDIPPHIPSLIFPSILKVINLRNSAVNDLILRHIAANSPLLQVLVLEDCSELTDSGVMKVASCCLDLETLDLSFCSKITDLSLQAFAIQAVKHTSKLKEVHLSACELITPATVHQFVKKCGKLELLVLDGCDKLNNTLIQELATIKDEIACTLERTELLRLAQLPIQQSSFGNELHLKNVSEVHNPEESSILRKKSRSIMASASVHVDYTGLAFAQRSERIKQNRLSRGSFVVSETNDFLTQPNLDRVAEKGRNLSMRRSVSSYRSKSPEHMALPDLLQKKLRLRANTLSGISPANDNDPVPPPRRSRPRPTTLPGVLNWSLPATENPNHKSGTVDADLPFIYSQDIRGRFLVNLKVEISKGIFKQLPLNEFDDPSKLAMEFCNFYNITQLSKALTRTLTMRKNAAIRRLLK
jgi:Leucine Rich repeat